MVLPKSWVATLHCSPVTSVQLNKMGFSGSLSVPFPYHDTLAYMVGLLQVFLPCPQCFPPYLWCIYVFWFFLLSLSNSNITKVKGLFVSENQFEA